MSLIVAVNKAPHIPIPMHIHICIHPETFPDRVCHHPDGCSRFLQSLHGPVQAALGGLAGPQPDVCHAGLVPGVVSPIEISFDFFNGQCVGQAHTAECHTQQHAHARGQAHISKCHVQCHAHI